jgi:ABC-type multidrug transport system fused ATPase/permease subunit
LFALGALFVVVAVFLPRGIWVSRRAREPSDGPALPSSGTLPQGGLMQYGFGQVEGPVLDTGPGTILYIEDLTVSFDGFRALNGLTLYVDDDELRCLIGPNGAGKTTLMDVITGKTRPQRGIVYFGHNIDLLSLSEPEIGTVGIGRKFQRPTVFEHQTVFENLWLALHANKAVWPTLVARLGNEARERIDEVLAITACRGSASGAPGGSPTARSNGSRSGCCSCRTRGSCSSTSRSRG